MENFKGKGWIKVHRSLKDKGYYKNSSYIHLWIHLLLSVNHEPTEFFWNGKIIYLKPGQFITGRKKISFETGIPETTIERVLNCLESEHQIGQQKTTKYRLITILNWEKWQEVDNKTDSKRTTDGQQTDTNNKGKNEKNEKKEREEKSSPTPQEKAIYFFKGITDFLQKVSSEESKSVGELLKRISLEQGVESLSRKKLFWDEIVKFGDYWQERDHLGKRERWQLEKTFEVEKRLQTWLKRAGQWSKPASQNNKGRGFA
jgi:hypothetical protein